MNLEAKHILFLPRWYPHQFDSMFGLFVKKHAQAVALNNKVSVVYVQSTNAKHFKQRQSIPEGNLYTLIFYYKHSPCKLWNALRFWYYNFKGFIQIKSFRGKPDIAHVHILTRLGLFAYLLNLFYDIPYLITEHWSRYLPIPNTYKGYFRKKLSRLVCQKASAILPVSQNLAKAMQAHKLLNKNYIVVPNVVDDAFFQSLRPKTKTTKFIHVSTFEDRSKNISGLLRSLNELSKKTKEFTFYLVGDGVDYKRLTTYAEDLNLSKALIQFLGLKKGQDLVNLYHQADCLVLFSNFENIPVVINEAQACGLPIIATNVGGISEVVNPGNGYLVEAGNEKELTSCLFNFIKNKPVFSAHDIQDEARQRSSFQSVGEKLNQIYSRIC
jgi:glycosyltransferase involved in cell wall biosynthesis